MKRKSNIVDLFPFNLYFIFFLIIIISCENGPKSSEGNDVSLDLNDIDSLCHRADSLIQMELSYSNLLYFPHMHLYSKFPRMEYSSSRFAELMWIKYKIIVAFSFLEEDFDSCYQVKMNEIVLKNIGYDAIIRTIHQADSIDIIKGRWLNLDSSLNFSIIEPTYPGGKYNLENELEIVDEDVLYNTAIWIDGIIDTNGHVTNVEIIRRGSPYHNKELVKRIKNELLPFTPAYDYDDSSGYSSNPEIYTYKKVRLKYRFVCKVLKKD